MAATTAALNGGQLRAVAGVKRAVSGTCSGVGGGSRGTGCLKAVGSIAFLRPIIAVKDFAEDEAGWRRQITEMVFESIAPQLDLSFAGAVYGLVGLFLGSLVGEVLVAALLPRYNFTR